MAMTLYWHSLSHDNSTTHVNMKSFIVFALFVAAAAAAVLPGSDERSASILNSELDNIGVGDSKYQYETSNGIRAEQSSQLVNAGQENEAVAVRGSYSYTGPDGVVYTVTYVADENGFQPSGAHIPQI